MRIAEAIEEARGDSSLMVVRATHAAQGYEVREYDRALWWYINGSRDSRVGWEAIAEDTWKVTSKMQTKTEMLLKDLQGDGIDDSSERAIEHLLKLEVERAKNNEGT